METIIGMTANEYLAIILSYIAVILTVMAFRQSNKK